MAGSNSQNLATRATALRIVTRSGVASEVFDLFGRPPKTNAEKRRAVVHAFSLTWPCPFSNSQMADLCGCSPSFVATMRKEVEEREERIRAERRQTDEGLAALQKAWRAANEEAQAEFLGWVNRSTTVLTLELLIREYAERLEACVTEAALDDLWNGCIMPLIDAERIDDDTLRSLQGLDDDRRGVIQAMVEV